MQASTGLSKTYWRSARPEQRERPTRLVYGCHEDTAQSSPGHDWPPEAIPVKPLETHFDVRRTAPGIGLLTKDEHDSSQTAVHSANPAESQAQQRRTDNRSQIIAATTK